MGNHLEEAKALSVLVNATQNALEDAFPEAEVEVVLQRASGAGPADVLKAVDDDGDDCAASSHDKAIVEHVCGQVWMAWCEAVGAGMESVEACLREGHEDALTSDALPSDSGVGADIPGEKILGREQATDAFRAGERAALLDARADIEDALDLDAVTEAGEEAVEAWLNELTDDEGYKRYPRAGDFNGLGAWSESAVSSMTTVERLKLAGIATENPRAAWALIQKRWCDAYNHGADSAVTEAREELAA